MGLPKRLPKGKVIGGIGYGKRHKPISTGGISYAKPHKPIKPVIKKVVMSGVKAPFKGVGFGFSGLLGTGKISEPAYKARIKKRVERKRKSTKIGKNIWKGVIWGGGSSRTGFGKR